MVNTKIILIFLFLLESFYSITQEWINYTTNEGLSGSQVYHITKDSKGYLWFATDAGITMYDGNSFTTFDTKDGLPDNVVFSFYDQPNGTLWGKTFSGKLFYFDDEYDFHLYKYNHVIQVICRNDNYPSEILFYKDKLYFSVPNRYGYYSIDSQGILDDNTSPRLHSSYRLVHEFVNGSSFTYYQDSASLIVPLFDKSIIASMLTSSNSMSGAATIDSTTIIIDLLNVVLINKSSSKKINTIEDPINTGVYDSTHFWVGYRNGGIAIYDLKGKMVKHYLNGKAGSSVFKDHEGGIWISTLYSGVFYLTNPDVSFHRFMDGDNNINRMTFDASGNLYIGYYNGMATLWDGKSSSILYSPEASYGSPSFVQYYDSLNSLVIGSKNTVFRLDRDNLLVPLGGLDILSLSDNPKQQVLIGQRRGFSLFNSSLEYHPTITRGLDICLSESGYYICSTQGLFEYKNSELTKVMIDPLFNVRINDIDEYHGKYFMASHGKGLIIFDNDTIFAIDSKDGLYSDLISQVLVENDSVLWVCTNKGLNKVVLKKNFEVTISGISILDGLVSNEVRDVEIKEGEVYIGTAKGLCTVKKSYFDKREILHPNFFLSLKKVLVNNKETNVKELLHLSHNQNKIVISFQGISFKYGKELQYRYKLQGLETDWNYTHSLEAIYPSIVSGNYQFILQAKGEFGEWEDNMLSFPLMIRSFYCSWSFIIPVSLLVISLTYLFFKYRVFFRNRDLVRELLRQLLKRFKIKTSYLVFKEQGKEIRIDTSDIYYVKAARNYLELVTTKKKYLLREKIGDFNKLVPDPIEFIRVHRSYIVRIDKISHKDNKSILVNGTDIPVGGSYLDELKKVFF